jgi:hypothetical protein
VDRVSAAGVEVVWGWHNNCDLHQEDLSHLMQNSWHDIHMPHDPVAACKAGVGTHQFQVVRSCRCSSMSDHLCLPALPRRFGFVYDNSCDLTLDQILLDLPPTREPVFYDLFLQTGTSTMYPVPVKVGGRAMRQWALKA